jgi:hypothetical protein
VVSTRSGKEIEEIAPQAGGEFPESFGNASRKSFGRGTANPCELVVAGTSDTKMPQEGGI